MLTDAQINDRLEQFQREIAELQSTILVCKPGNRKILYELVLEAKNELHDLLSQQLARRKLSGDPTRPN